MINQRAGTLDELLDEKTTTSVKRKNTRQATKNEKRVRFFGLFERRWRGGKNETVTPSVRL